MSIKLSKSDIIERQEIADRITAAKAELEDTLSEFNSVLEEAKSKLQEKIEGYNRVLSDAREFAERIHSDGQSEYDERSEKWQEGERGEQARDWLQQWEGIDLSDLDIDLPDEVQIDIEDHADNLLGLSDEPGLE